MKRKASRLHGVGIDVVSRHRVGQFVSRHRDAILKRFLNPSERRNSAGLDRDRLAELFTAKEAFFKACGESWMGLEGFRGMRITRRDGNRFEMEWKPARAARAYRGEGYFFRAGDLVGAQAMIWS